MCNKLKTYTEKIFNVATIICLMVVSSCYSITSDTNEENFDDLLTTKIEWLGEKEKFVINQNEGVHLADIQQSAKRAHLYFLNDRVQNTRWEFAVKMSFNPSAQNYACFFLTSDNTNLKQELNGYYVKVGGHKDHISLNRREGNRNYELVSSSSFMKNLNTVHVYIRVERNDKGYWRLYYRNHDENEYKLIGEIKDNTLKNSVCSGVVCYYTHKGNHSIWFHHVSVSETNFTEKKTDKDNDKKEDNGKEKGDNDYTEYKTSRELLINEIMFDADKDGEEYVEVYANTKQPITITTLYLHKIKSTKIISSIELIGKNSYTKQLKIKPKQYICFSRSVYKLTEKHGATEELIVKVPKMPRFNNNQSGAIIISKHKDISNGELIDICRFSKTMHTIEKRDKKGIAIEKKQPTDISEDDNNWRSSHNPSGGTPTKENT